MNTHHADLLTHPTSQPQGRPPGVIGMWPSRGITFIDNHDTGSTLNHWPFPSRHLPEGYAYILTHPGEALCSFSPCMYEIVGWEG